MNTDLFHAVGAGFVSFLIVSGYLLQLMNRRLDKLMAVEAEDLPEKQNG